MKNIAKLLVFVLLMQHGVTQASGSWIYEEMLGAKQARVAKYAGGENKTLFSPNTTNRTDDSNIVQHYHTLRKGAEYLEQRKNAIKPWATLGLAYLCYRESDSEMTVKNSYNNIIHSYLSDEDIIVLNQKLKDFPQGGCTRSLSAYTSTYENIIEQFDREQKMYQNRIVATILLGVAGIAGYLLANKK